jgi:site-specific DNA-methyltransferase (adenine-specific)
VPKAYGAGETYPHQILGKSFVSGPNTACTQSYLVIGPFSSESAAISFHTYYSTRFFRFLVSLRKITQDALRSTYSWVPKQTWDRQWTDQMLFEKYGLTEDEIAFIETIVRPMDMDLFDSLAED